MKMEPQVVVVTHSPVSRAASLLREAGYLVTKSTPEMAGSQPEAEALIVDLPWFELVLWLDEQEDDDDRILVLAPTAVTTRGVPPRIISPTDLEDDLVSAVDRIVADQRIAAYGRQPVTTPAYSPLTSFFGAMAR